MNLMQAWRDSLKLFAPQNCKTFALVTVKAVIDAYKLMLQYWWLWIGIMLAGGLLTTILKPITFLWFTKVAVLLVAVRHLLFFLLCLAMRPSVGLKTMDYFRQYTLKFWYIILLALAFGIIGMSTVPLFLIFFTFFVLFVFDSDGAFESIGLSVVRAFVMLLYNLPLCFLVYVGLMSVNIVASLMALGLSIVLNGGEFLFAFLLYLFLVPIEIGILTNIYIKKLHEQSGLYFRQP